MEANKKASKLRKTADEEMDEVEEVDEVDEVDEEEVTVVKGKGKAKVKEVDEEVEEEKEQEGEDASVEEKDVIPKREANARWPERCKEVKGVKHYSAVTMDGHLYKLGDDVTVQGEPNGHDFMGTIKEIFKPAKGEVSCLLRWYFRYSDTAMGALGDGIVDPRLCFWSRETDDNPASCITGRVRVKRVKPPSGPKEPLDIPADVDLVYHHMYAYDFASFSDIPNDECEQNLDCLPDPPAVHPPGSNGVIGGGEGEKHEVERKAKCNGTRGGDGGEKAVQSKEEEGATGKDEGDLKDECVDAEGGGGRRGGEAKIVEGVGGDVGASVKTGEGQGAGEGEVGKKLGGGEEEGSKGQGGGEGAGGIEVTPEGSGGVNGLEELEDKKADGKTEGTAVEGVKVESGGAVGGVSEVGGDNQEKGEGGKGENGKGEEGKGESEKGEEGKEVEGKTFVKVEDPAVGSMKVESEGAVNDAGETGDSQEKRDEGRGENGKGEDGKKEEGKGPAGKVEGTAIAGMQVESGGAVEGAGVVGDQEKDEEGKQEEGTGEEGKGEQGRKEESEGHETEEGGKEDEGEQTSKAASGGKKGRLSGGGARTAAAPATVTLPPQTMRLKMLDMYSGCGAMSTGIEMGGTPRGVTIDTCWSVDFNAAACESMKYNHPLCQVRNETADEFLVILKELPSLLERYSVSSAAAADAVFMDGEKGGKAVAHKHKVVHHSHHQHQEQQQEQQQQQQEQEQGGEGSMAKVENTKEVEMGDAEEAAGKKEELEEVMEEVEDEIEEVEERGRGKRKRRASAEKGEKARTSGRNKRQKEGQQSNGAPSNVNSGKEMAKAEEDESSDEEVDEGEFEVGRIVGVRYIAATEKGRPAGIYFKVQWKGYGPEEDTWEGEDSLSSCKPAIRDYLVEVKEKKLLPLPGDVDIICGGPPCQGVSGFNRFRNTEDPLACEKNRQLVVFMDLVGWLAPTWVLMENVVDLMKFKEGILAKYAIARLVAMGYKCSSPFPVHPLLIPLAPHFPPSPQSPCLPPLSIPSPLPSSPPSPSQALPSFPLPTHLVAKERGTVPTRWMVSADCL
ncbi:unnamed protein product [Closterium sp. Naga37s-1]|nr:unnamed protein product [Closterium sp. Naga37s-1]